MQERPTRKINSPQGKHSSTALGILILQIAKFSTAPFTNRQIKQSCQKFNNRSPIIEPSQKYGSTTPRSQKHTPLVLCGRHRLAALVFLPVASLSDVTRRQPSQSERTELTYHHYHNADGSLDRRRQQVAGRPVVKNRTHQYT